MAVNNKDWFKNKFDVYWIYTNFLYVEYKYEITYIKLEILLK